jgi:hypothetical protein
MLIEEQVHGLLLRCERLLGTELRRIRGDLRNADNRAAAIWELIVLDAAMTISPIEYEPLQGSSPDICLNLPYGRSIWIEVTYIYPRFWQEERQTTEVRRWLFSEIKRRGIPTGKILIYLYGEQTKAGRVPKLPKSNEKKKFLSHPELEKLYDRISSYPSESYNCYLTPYTISLSYQPEAKPPLSSFGGPIHESPTNVKEHAVYRKLKEKAKQFHVQEPLVICLGSDQSPALSEVSGRAHIHRAVQAAFLEHHSLSAVIIVSIALRPVILGELSRKAHVEILINPYARYPLKAEEIQSLRKIDFNRWRYTYPIEKNESDTIKRDRRVTGHLTWRPKAMGIEIEIPSNIVIDALAGKKSLTEAYRLPKNHQISRILNDGWVIESCSLKEGNLEAGEATKIVLELVPPSIALFKQKKSKSDNDS